MDIPVPDLLIQFGIVYTPFTRGQTHPDPNERYSSSHGHLWNDCPPQRTNSPVDCEFWGFFLGGGDALRTVMRVHKRRLLFPGM